MSFIAAAVVVGTTYYQTKENKKAQKDARRDELEDRRQARKEEIFAETEGQGLGNIGQVSLEVDDELDDENLDTTVRI